MPIFFLILLALFLQPLAAAPKGMVTPKYIIPKMQKAGEEGDDDFPSEDPVKIAAIEWRNSTINMGWSLYRQLRASPGNILFSPYAVTEGLLLLYAATSGEAHRELSTFLQFKGESSDLREAVVAANKQLETAFSDQEKKKLSFFNFLWLQKGFALQRRFEEEIIKFLAIGVKSANFSTQPLTSRERINLFTKQITDNQIVDIIAPNALSVATRLLLTSTATLSLPWENPFSVNDTSFEAFFSSNKSTVTVRTMRLQASLPFYEEEGFVAFLMPYRATTISLALLVVLPKEEHTLAEIEERLSDSLLEEWLKKFENKKINLAIPTFKIRQTVSLKKPLEALGIKTIFTDRADFSHLIYPTAERLSLSAFIHQSLYSIVEGGSGSAKRIEKSVKGTTPQTPLYLRVNRPFFIALINTKTREPFLMGRVASPMEEKAK